MTSLLVELGLLVLMVSSDGQLWKLLWLLAELDVFWDVVYRVEIALPKPWTGLVRRWTIAGLIVKICLRMGICLYSWLYVCSPTSVCLSTYMFAICVVLLLLSVHVCYCTC